MDTAHHVITDIRAYHADGKDKQQLPDIVKRVQRRFWQQGLVWENCVADTGYSSGENYAFPEERGLKGFIPPHGTQKGGPDGFTYNREADHYLCPKGKVIPFTKEFLDYRTKMCEERGKVPCVVVYPKMALPKPFFYTGEGLFRYLRKNIRIKKALAEELIWIRFSQDQGLAQRLPMLYAVYLVFYKVFHNFPQ